MHVWRSLSAVESSYSRFGCETKPIFARSMTSTLSQPETSRGSVQIRPATLGDRPRLVAIQTAAIAAQCQPHYTAAQMAALLTDKAVFRYSDERVFVAIAANRGVEEAVVGFIALSQRGNSIQGLFVAPQYFRQGIGRQLLAYLEAEALLTDRRHLLVMSALNAEAFYRAQGFVRVKASNTFACGCSIPAVAMRKLLPAPAAPRHSARPPFRQSQHLLLLGWFLLGGTLALGLAIVGTAVSPSGVLMALLALGFLGGSRIA